MENVLNYTEKNIKKATSSVWQRSLGMSYVSARVTTDTLIGKDILDILGYRLGDGFSLKLRLQ